MQKKVEWLSTPTSEMSMPSTLPTENKMTRRKSAASYNKELCAFCQENKKDNAPHEVRSESMGARIKYVAEMKLENQLATVVCKKITEQGGVYLPPSAVKNKPVYFAQDNIDFDEANSDGTNILHGTIIVLFQQETDKAPMSNEIEIDPKSKETVSLSDYDVPLSHFSFDEAISRNIF